MCRLSLACAAALILGAALAEEAAVDWSSAERLSDGIDLIRLSYDKPRLMKAQALRVDLGDKSLAFTSTGRAGRWGLPMPDYTNLTVCTRRMTVEEFMMNARAPVELGGRGLDMIVAFNTTPWTPCPEPIPTPYGQLHGFNVSDGIVVSDTDKRGSFNGVFVMRKDGSADILPAPLSPAERAAAWIAHTGFAIVLKDSRALYTAENDGEVHPRTVLGLSRDRRWLYVLVLEGRHEGVSIGADYFDLANIMLSLGASDALNVDGGGSSALMRWDEAAERQVTCFAQESPPRRNAFNLGICRRHAAGTTPGRALDEERLFEAAIDADRERSAGIFHRYEFEDVRDTPPPEGYKPFYISHYGRHGSRYQRDERCLQACTIMRDAARAGILEDPGKALLKRLDRIAAAHVGRFESLAIRGAEEQRRLARRMYDRFPEVFADSGKVRCKSSTFHRCLVSMSNFSSVLKGAAPQLDFEFESGDWFTSICLHPHYDKKNTNAKIEEMRKRVLVETVKPDRLMKFLFVDSPETDKVVGSRHLFAASLFAVASAFQSLDRELDGLDIYDFFTRDEILDLARYGNFHYYACMGNSVEFGDSVVWCARNLAKDFADRADEALEKPGVCADLRFGHDSTLMPIAGLIGLEGPGNRVPAAESWKRCPLWKYLAMASNLQMVFYRKDGADVLVKVLFNERETAVKGLEPVCGKYYRWNDIRSRLLP